MFRRKSEANKEAISAANCMKSLMVKKKKKKDIHLHKDSNKYATFRILSDQNDNHVNIKLNLIVVKKFNALH